MLELTRRPRRNRRTAVLRGFARETQLDASRFIQPAALPEGGESARPPRDRGLCSAGA